MAKWQRIGKTVMRNDTSRPDRLGLHQGRELRAWDGSAYYPACVEWAPLDCDWRLFRAARQSDGGLGKDHHFVAYSHTPRTRVI
jgi:hypothetical protein